MNKFFFEIKNRLLLVLLSTNFLFLTTYMYKDFFFLILVRAISCFIETPNQKDVYFILTDVTELFSVYVLLTGSITAQLMFYFAFYHFFNFFGSALFIREFKAFKLIFKTSLLFFCASAATTLFSVIPNMWFFFLNFQNVLPPFLKAKIFFEIKISEYVVFLLNTYFLFFFCFQTLLVFFLLYSILQITTNFIEKYRKLHYFLVFFISSLVCPFELFLQFILSGVLVFTYELFTFLCLLKKNVVSSAKS